MASIPAGQWLLITISTAGAEKSLRMFVWRRLRGLGALYLQQSVCLLPQLPETDAAVAELLERVERDGGQGHCLHITTTDEAETARLVAQMQDAATDEYDDLLERLPDFFGELEKEIARGRATFPEVEENEADLERFQTWNAKIRSRDYFDAPRGETVRAELERAAEALEQFETMAIDHQSPNGDSHR